MSKVFLFSPCTVKPTAPTNLQLEIKERVTVRITSNEPQCFGQHGIAGYFIYYKLKDDTFKITPMVECCEHKIEKLEEGANYEVFVVAVDGQGTEGDKSQAEIAKTGGKL